MGFSYFKMILKLFLLSLLPLIVTPLNSTKIECNFQEFGSIGCPQNTHMVCNNQTNYCQCNQTSEYGISFGDNECLSLRNIDQMCVTSDQCSKTKNRQLFCYFLSNDNQKPTKLDTNLALNLKKKLNKTVEGFCRCDEYHYYDYEENQCIYQNPNQDITPPFFQEYFCRQCPVIDDNSHCNHKSQTCDCNEGYIKNSFGKCIEMRHLYEKCDHSDQCVVSHSYCEPIVGQCLCKFGTYPDYGKQQCLKGRAIHDKCAAHQECSYQYGYCDPKTWVCNCDPNESLYFSFNCVRKTGYGQTCEDNYSDLVCELSLPHTLCSKYTNRCVCENGYLYMSDVCQKININRFAFNEDFRPVDDNKNPMTYILIIFSAIFGATIIASVLIKLFRGNTRTPISIYDANRRSSPALDLMNSNNQRREPRRLPTAPPEYSESRLRENSQTNSSNSSDNEDKPPSYEEAISGHYSVQN